MIRKLLWVLRAIYGVIYFVLRGGVANARRLGVKVGQNCRIYVRSFGTEPFLISIGNRVTVTSGVTFLTHDGSTWLIRNENGQRFQRYAPITIGDDVFVGINAIIMPGVSIGNKVIVAAGSVVTRDIPNRSVVAGVPARVIKSFDEFECKIRDECASDEDLASFPSYEGRVYAAIDINRKKILD